MAKLLCRNCKIILGLVFRIFWSRINVITKKRKSNRN